MKEIFTSLITPFNEDQTIDYPGLYRVLDYLIEKGQKSFLLCGTEGETTTLKVQERRLLVEKVLDKYPQIRVVVGIASNSTIEVIKHIDMYKDNPRIYAYLVIVPYYIQPSQAGLYKHFDLIASSTKRKIMIYNDPRRCGVNMEVDTIIKLASKHKNIIGMKQCGNLYDIETIKDVVPQFKVYIGDDYQLLSGLKHRADGIFSVSSHIDYDLVKKVCLEENIFDAEYLSLISQYLTLEPSPAPIKYIISQLGLIQNVLRSPLTPVIEQNQIKLNGIVEKYKK